MREKRSYSFLRSLVKIQDHSFFKDLMGVFCTGGGTLVKIGQRKFKLDWKQIEDIFEGFFS
jgi:hypothetical protein